MGFCVSLELVWTPTRLGFGALGLFPSPWSWFAAELNGPCLLGFVFGGSLHLSASCYRASPAPSLDLLMEEL